METRNEQSHVPNRETNRTGSLEVKGVAWNGVKHQKFYSTVETAHRQVGVQKVGTKVPDKLKYHKQILMEITYKLHSQIRTP